MARIITYGAYNLCFDPTLGQIGGRGPDFFKYMTDNRYPVNRIKVILYRKSYVEELIEGQTITLFAGRRLNPAFLGNLKKLIQRARDTGMTVQLCLFSYHSVVGGEEPESPPAALDTASWSPNRCQKLRRFFSLDDAAVVQAQTALVRAIVTHVGGSVGFGNVVFEIANELRTDVCKIGNEWDAEKNRQGNCQMVRWLNAMAEVIRAAAAPARVHITTSTGTHDESIIRPQIGEANEGIVFDKYRRTGSCAAPAAFVPDFFDLHAGQWEPAGINWFTQRAAYLAALPASIAAAGARLHEYGYLSPEVVINDDGLGDDKRDALLEHYVRAAFEAGYGYASKQEYPPLRFDTVALGILKRLKDIPVGPASPLEP